MAENINLLYITCFLTLLFLVIAISRIGIKHGYNMMYAFVCTRIAHALSKSKTIDALKTNLFGNMESGKQIVEIGAGSGANMQFFPAHSSVKCVEPKLEFEHHFAETIRTKGTHLQAVDFIEGKAENLSSVIQPNTVDYVVCTFVLCSVDDITAVTSEIMKILKPVSLINDHSGRMSFDLSYAVYFDLMCMPVLCKKVLRAFKVEYKNVQTLS